MAAATRWPAVLDGGAAAQSFFFLIFFVLFSSTPSPLHNFGLKISKHQRYGPRSERKEKEKKVILFCYFRRCSRVVFGFDVMIVDCVWIVFVVRFCVVCVAAVCASVRFVLCAGCVILAVFVPLVCFIAGLLWWTPFLCSCCRCIYKKEAWPPRV